MILAIEWWMERQKQAPNKENLIGRELTKEKDGIIVNRRHKLKSDP